MTHPHLCGARKSREHWGVPLEKAECSLVPECTCVCKSHTVPGSRSQETQQLIFGKERDFAAEREKMASNQSKRIVSEHREKFLPSREGAGHTAPGLLEAYERAGLRAVFLRNRTHLLAN